MRLTQELLVTGVIWACVVGFLGGLFPAIRAARLPIVAAPQTGDDHDVPSFAADRDRIKDKLGDHYLDMGTLNIQRRALPTAEEYNVSACRLDPESGGCTVLQERIIQARLSNGWRR